MATIIKSNVSLIDREKGFKDALDLMIANKISTECSKDLYNGVYYSLFLFFLRDLEEKKEQLFNAFGNFKNLNKEQLIKLHKAIEEL
jgi:hypothetical protein